MLNALQLFPNWLPLFWTVYYAADFRGRIPRTSRSLETGTRQKRADLIRERTRAGVGAAATRGRKGGRKAVITAEILARAKMALLQKLAHSCPCERGSVRWQPLTGCAFGDPPMTEDFKWRHFRGEIILWAVRWYCRYGVSYRDLEEMLEERGVAVDHTTIYRWVQAYAPEIERRFARICARLHGRTDAGIAASRAQGSRLRDGGRGNRLWRRRRPSGRDRASRPPGRGRHACRRASGSPGPVPAASP